MLSYAGVNQPISFSTKSATIYAKWRRREMWWDQGCESHTVRYQPVCTVLRRNWYAVGVISFRLTFRWFQQVPASSSQYWWIPDNTGEFRRYATGEENEEIEEKYSESGKRKTKKYKEGTDSCLSNDIQANISTMAINLHSPCFGLNFEVSSKLGSVSKVKSSTSTVSLICL